MADHQFLQNITQSFSLADINDQFPGPNPVLSGPIGFPSDVSFFSQTGLGNVENFPGFFTIPDEIASLSQPNVVNHREFKRKTMEITTPQSRSAFTSSLASDSETKKKKRVGKEKKVKVEKSEDETREAREVVHVRAKRGQATDSHSLAERVRRKKINERLRCLQDIVPGCYKTMGMAVMLDEIISYVQSLQSQVEFLSMRLTAATAFHDFGLDADAMAAIQGSKAYEALNVQNLATQGHNFAQFAESGFNFSNFPQLRHNI